MGFFDRLENPVFLKEESDTAEYIKKLEILKNKADGNLKKQIEQEILFVSLGEVGEKRVAFELKNSGIPMYVLRDIHLTTGDLSAQIDYIVITRKRNFIIECKNLYGNIEIDNQGNFIREYNIKRKFIREGIYSPITQNQRHLEVIKQIRKGVRSNIITKRIFESSFDENYRSIVVLANPKTILKSNYAKKEIIDKVIRADQLIQFIKDECKKSKNPETTDKYMKDLAEFFLSEHKPKESDYAKKFEEIIYKNNMRGQQFETVKQNTVVAEEVKVLITDKENNDNSREELIKELKAFRLAKAREENSKPYLIFTDRHMMDLVEKMPESKDSLLKVFGFGQARVEKYGDDILEIIKRYILKNESREWFC